MVTDDNTNENGAAAPPPDDVPATAEAPSMAVPPQGNELPGGGDRGPVGEERGPIGDDRGPGGGRGYDRGPGGPMGDRGPGGPMGDRGRGGPPRRGGRPGPRRKVCVFCADHIELIDYKEVGRLRRYISELGKIEPRRKTGNCARHQRRLALALKRARHLALLPYTADHIRVTGATYGPQR
jgi:small subunit ribosomal protein S18